MAPALGSSAAVVEIAPDGDPSALLGMEISAATVSEGEAVQVIVRRDYYALGAVSVTLTTTLWLRRVRRISTRTQITISWSDGECGAARDHPRPVTDDTDDEPHESFTVALAQPTGGAVVGPLSSSSITIDDNDFPSPPPVAVGSSGCRCCCSARLGLRASYAAGGSMSCCAGDLFSVELGSQGEHRE